MTTSERSHGTTGIRREGLKILLGASADKPPSCPSPPFVTFSLEFTEAYSSSFSPPQVFFDRLSWGFALVGAFDCRFTFLFPF